jgi:hypothetical protein
VRYVLDAVLSLLVLGSFWVLAYAANVCAHAPAFSGRLGDPNVPGAWR